MRIKIDVAIIGAGPAGLSAGQYGARAGLSCVVFDGAMSGGQTLLIDMLDNYPGILAIDGFGFAGAMEQQAKNFGVQFVLSMVHRVYQESHKHVIELANGDIYEAYAVIVATGAKYAKLGVPGEEAFLGKGVSYCATCDGPFFKNQPILVVGGGDTAFSDALFLSGLSDRIVLIHRRDKFRAQHYLVEQVKANPRIEIRTFTELKEIQGEQKVSRVVLLENQSGRTYEEEFGAVFIFVGTYPQTELFPYLDKDESGYIITNSKLESSVKGIYVAGDVRNTHFRQVVTACADGALTAHMAGAYIDTQRTLTL
ncbi:NAD(P)/FAD-dependent oxidoreductase [Entomospira culicis]|uniref:FAD-dependent oxidoreductase n=1 Tax=Entomospira culicis TaxID=2719989 RepID=A0A968KZQ1_9SPIO|nr:FAD-dependent oxidoreductase [Entomospira culicis]NIZ19534.1 FAD-dependent oxidoreductase [Entomospira culicis]NIZ69561.1 FAD-dependent oxidoreductase [Entomospira culicis]WDI36672.1 FAD-dependent oxidoreductase [Entomospira culicis]WDI38301.1 FAD-dependent oxidoreductase [Entomospira culicis]